MGFDIPDYVLPFVICLARIADVSLGTLRTVAVVRGQVLVAAVLGFFEIVIWVLAAGRVLTSLDNPFNVIGYAGGFALGNAVGISIEQKLAIGRVTMRVFTRDHGPDLADALRERGLRVTEIDGRGKLGPVTILYVILERVDVAATQKIVIDIDDDAFIAWDESRRINRLLHPTVAPATGWRSLMRK
jgi:uncharacterized protein YebE (UPF0316 family)